MDGQSWVNQLVCATAALGGVACAAVLARQVSQCVCGSYCVQKTCLRPCQASTKGCQSPRTFAGALGKSTHVQVDMCSDMIWAHSYPLFIPKS